MALTLILVYLTSYHSGIYMLLSIYLSHSACIEYEIVVMHLPIFSDNGKVSEPLKYTADEDSKIKQFCLSNYL